MMDRQLRGYTKQTLVLQICTPLLTSKQLKKRHHVSGKTIGNRQNKYNFPVHLSKASDSKKIPFGRDCLTTTPSHLKNTALIQGVNENSLSTMGLQLSRAKTSYFFFFIPRLFPHNPLICVPAVFANLCFMSLRGSNL